MSEEQFSRDAERSPPQQLVLDDLSLEDLWREREDVDEDLRRLRDRKAALDMELVRRVREARPDFEEGSAGSAELVTPTFVVRMSWTRDYEYNESALITLGQLLSGGEYARLVKWSPKVNGVLFNQLHHRGGLLAETLDGARKLVRSNAKFERRERT